MIACVGCRGLWGRFRGRFLHACRFGNVEDSFIPTDRETGRSRGFGFVTMETNAATAAMGELSGTEFMGRTIRVNEASPPGGGRLFRACALACLV